MSHPYADGGFTYIDKELLSILDKLIKKKFICDLDVVTRIKDLQRFAARCANFTERGLDDK